MAKKKVKKVELDEESTEFTTRAAEKDMFLDIAPYLIIIFFIVVIRIFIATPVSVNGTSMFPTLEDGDTMLLYKLAKTTRGIKREDIVVIETGSGKLIKRVIGKPGDRIQYKKEKKDDQEIYVLYRNGKKIKEEYLEQEVINQTCLEEWDICKEEIKLGKEEYYVLGDNRGNSKDSRMLGTIDYDDILGITELVIFPFNRFGIKE